MCQRCGIAVPIIGKLTGLEMTGCYFTKKAKVAYLFSLTDLFVCDFLEHKTLGGYYCIRKVYPK
jgi:hypothetical protein